MDDTDAPAILVRVGRLRFPADTARLFVTEARAGRWGKGVECAVVRQPLDAGWTVKRCEVIEQY